MNELISAQEKILEWAKQETLVRALLVPALMRLFGQVNWWAPRWLRRVYDRSGLGH